MTAPSQPFPKEAIEAAARAIDSSAWNAYDTRQRDYIFAVEFQSRLESSRRVARIALTAAAPFFAAERETTQLAEDLLFWARKQCPADDESKPCPLCGARADAIGPDGICKAEEYKLPLALLDRARSIVGKNKEVKP